MNPPLYRTVPYLVLAPAKMSARRALLDLRDEQVCALEVEGELAVLVHRLGGLERLTIAGNTLLSDAAPKTSTVGNAWREDRAGLAANAGAAMTSAITSARTTTVSLRLIEDLLGDHPPIKNARGGTPPQT